MRTLLFIFFFCRFSVAAQTPSDVMLTESFPATGILLNKGWKFHAGDDATYAKPQLDDSKWQTIDPTQNISDVVPFKGHHIGWLRLKLKISDAMFNQVVGLSISQFGASEIYLNGRLIHAFGKVSTSKDGEQSYNPMQAPIALPLSNFTDQTVAVRFSSHAPRFASLEFPLFAATLNTFSASTESYENMIMYLANSSFLGGMFGIIALLHFFLFLMYRNQRKNLFLSLYATFFACTFLSILLLFLGHSSSAQIGAIALFRVAAPLAFIFYVKTTYELFGYKTGPWFLVITGYCIAAIFLQWAPVDWLRRIGLMASGVIAIIEIIRVTMVARKNGRLNANIYLAGQVLSLLFFIAMTLASTFNIGRSNLAFELILLDGSFMIPPVLLSYLFASEVAKTNRSLEHQLMQVEQLSAKSIAQEQEKKQILESQNVMLEKKVEERTRDLKNAQQQLIHQEKLASLGILTAGIAHEIQNPLNFVNNFSEVSKELLDEMKSELETGNTSDAIEIASDVRQNLEKILHHGKRADAIVKGMLQHSRSNSSAIKEPTDINKLADECLRLSYHGLRAKDKSLNADYKGHFDDAIGMIEVVPQDIGRVLLNLLNNAFYSVAQKKKQATEGYEPLVELTTERMDKEVRIRVKDNGLGISQAVVDKIYQPFFTTKPTGQGTGLGLSMSYDIITKEHGGTLEVRTKEGEYAEFDILLPAYRNFSNNTNNDL